MHVNVCKRVYVCANESGVRVFVRVFVRCVCIHRHTRIRGLRRVHACICMKLRARYVFEGVRAGMRERACVCGPSYGECMHGRGDVRIRECKVVRVQAHMGV